MKTRLILAATLALAMAAPSYAQRIVHDPQSNALRVAEAGKSLLELQAQLTQLRATYDALAHATDISNVAGALGGFSRTYLPDSASTLGALSRGAGGGPQTMLGESDRYLQGNRFYRSPEEDRWQTEMLRREEITANAQALGERGFMDVEDRLQKLSVLEARLNVAQDVTEVSAINGAIAIERANLEAHNMAMRNLSLMVSMDDRVTMQRQEQSRRRAADELFDSTQPATEGFR